MTFPPMARSAASAAPLTGRRSVRSPAPGKPRSALCRGSCTNWRSRCMRGTQRSWSPAAHHSRRNVARCSDGCSGAPAGRCVGRGAHPSACERAWCSDIRLAHERVLESWPRAREIVTSNLAVFRVRDEAAARRGLRYPETQRSPSSAAALLRRRAAVAGWQYLDARAAKQAAEQAEKMAASRERVTPSAAAACRGRT